MPSLHFARCPPGMPGGRAELCLSLPHAKDTFFKDFYQLLPRQLGVLIDPEPRMAGWVSGRMMSVHLPAPLARGLRGHPQAPSASCILPLFLQGAWGVQLLHFGTDSTLCTQCHAFLHWVKLVPEKWQAQGLPSTGSHWWNAKGVWGDVCLWHFPSFSSCCWEQAWVFNSSSGGKVPTDQDYLLWTL